MRKWVSSIRKRKNWGPSGVDLEVIDKPLFRYPAFVRYWRKVRRV